MFPLPQHDFVPGRQSGGAVSVIGMGIKMINRISLISGLLCFTLAGSLFAAQRIEDRDERGRFALGHYMVDDSSSAGDVNVTHLYYRYMAKKLGPNDNISLNIDGRARASSSDYNNEIPENRLLQANVQIKKMFGGLDLTIGRSFIEEFVSQNVDGFDLKYWFNKKNGVGVFGGARPDPFEDNINTDFLTWGGYAFVHSDLFGASGGYALDTYKGEVDRERANGVFYFMPATQRFQFQSSIDLDNDVDTYEHEEGESEGWEITNLLLHGNWRPNKMFLFSFTYNLFRAINREKSFEPLVGEDSFVEENYSIARISAEVRPIKNYGLYIGGDSRERKIDSKSASQYYLGIRNYNFIYNTRWNLRYSDLGWFTANVKSLYGSVGWSYDKIDIEAAVTRLTNSQDGLENEMQQWVYDLYATWWFSRYIYGTVSFSYSQEEYLDVSSIYTTRYADNFSTTTLYGQIGYRF